MTDHRSSPAGQAVPRDVVAFLRTVAGRGWALAGTGAHAVDDRVEDALRVLVGRRVARALRPGSARVSTDQLVDALGPRSGPVISPWIGAGAARLARTGRAVKVLGARTPLGLAVRFGPAVSAAVVGNVRRLDAAIARLVTRARDDHVEPDPERLRRVAVQALAGEPIDPDVPVDHRVLARVWMGEAGRRAIPFGLDRFTGLPRGRTPEAVAAVLDSVAVNHLAQPRRRITRRRDG